MSKDGKKPLGDSSVFQKGRKGAMRVIYGRTAIIAVSFLAQIILIGGVVNFFRPYIPMFFGGYVCLLTFAAGFTPIYFLSKKEAQGTN